MLYTLMRPSNADSMDNRVCPYCTSKRRPFTVEEIPLALTVASSPRPYQKTPVPLEAGMRAAYGSSRLSTAKRGGGAPAPSNNSRLARKYSSIVE